MLPSLSKPERLQLLEEPMAPCSCWKGLAASALQRAGKLGVWQPGGMLTAGGLHGSLMQRVSDEKRGGLCGRRGDTGVLLLLSAGNGGASLVLEVLRYVLQKHRGTGL